MYDWLDLVLGGLAIILGFLIRRYYDRYLLFKKKYEQLLEVLKVIEQALADDKITKEELKRAYDMVKQLFEEDLKKDISQKNNG